MPKTILAMLICLFTSGASADLVTFSFSNSDDQKKTISQTVDGLTMTLSNPVGPGGGYEPFTVFSSALLLSDWTAPYRFDMSFSKDVQLAYFRVQSGEVVGSATFDLLQGYSKSLGNDVGLPHGETRAFTNTTDTFLANTAIDWISTGTVNDAYAYRIANITVNVVPEPSAWVPAVLATVGGLGCIRRRRYV